MCAPLANLLSRSPGFPISGGLQQIQNEPKPVEDSAVLQTWKKSDSTGPWTVRTMTATAQMDMGWCSTRRMYGKDERRGMVDTKFRKNTHGAEVQEGMTGTEGVHHREVNGEEWKGAGTIMRIGDADGDTAQDPERVTEFLRHFTNHEIPQRGIPEALCTRSIISFPPNGY